LLGFAVGTPIKPNVSCPEARMAKLKAILDEIGAEKLA